MDAYDAPTRSDFTAADAELFAHDQAQPPHDTETCTVTGCWACANPPLRGAA